MTAGWIMLAGYAAKCLLPTHSGHWTARDWMAAMGAKLTTAALFCTWRKSDRRLPPRFVRRPTRATPGGSRLDPSAHSARALDCR